MSTAFQTLDVDTTSPFARVENLQQLGQLLRDVRRAHKKELSTIASDLRLKQDFLEALEAGQWDKLPSDTYGRGYLRQYAEYLHLPPQEAASCCQRIQGKVDSKLQYLEIVSTNDTPQRSTLWFSAFAIGATLIGWGWYQSPSNSLQLGLPIAAPEMAEFQPVIARPAVDENISAGCLQIPARFNTTCHPLSSAKPSFLLKTSQNYPIWER